MVIGLAMARDAIAVERKWSSSATAQSKEIGRRAGNAPSALESSEMYPSTHLSLSSV
jgi:hypothetical protein